MSYVKYGGSQFHIEDVNALGLATLVCASPFWDDFYGAAARHKIASRPWKRIFYCSYWW
jgi:hypothetical protein